MTFLAKLKGLFKSKDLGEPISEDNDEGEVFRLMTPKLLTEFDAMRAERKRKLKEAENKQIVIQERIVDGEVTYTTSNGEDDEEDDDYLYDNFYDGRDPQLIEGNPVPIKLGLLPKQIYQRPAIEIDSYIHKKDPTFVVLSKRFKKPQIYRFSSTKSLFLLTPFHKLRRALIWFVTWQ